MLTIRHFFIALSALGIVACTQTQDGASVVRPANVPEPVAQESPRPQSVSKPRPVRTPKKTTPVVPTKSQRPFVPRTPGHRVSQVNVPGKYVALTFDDGPSSANTPQILDILQRHGARATFFVLGENAARNKSLLARAVAEGHEIANHTYSHIKMTGVSKQTVAREIERTNEIIKSATGFYPTAMRPPYGAINSGLVDMMYNDYGMHAVLWDVDTRDWQHPGVSTVVQRAVGNAQSGSIILLHDIHASTVAAVEEIVTGLQARGFKLVTVSQLIEMGRRAAAPAPVVTPPAPATPEPPAAEDEPVLTPGAGEAVIGTMPSEQSETVDGELTID